MDGLVGYASGDSENSPSPSPNPPPPQWPRGVPKVEAMESKDANLMEEWQSFEKLIGEDMKSSEVTDDPKKTNLPRRSHSSSDSSRSRSRSKSSASSHSSSSRSRSNSPAKKSKLKKKKSRSSSSSSSDSDSVLPSVENGLPNQLAGGQEIPDKPPSKHSSSDSDEEAEPVKVKLASKSPPPVAAAAATPAAPIVHRISSRSRSRSPHRRRRSRSRDRRRRRSGSRSRRRRGRRRRSHSRHRSRSGDCKDKADGDKQTGDSHDRRRSRSRDRRRHGRRRSRSRSRDRRHKRHRGERSWRRSHRKRRRSADHKKRSRSKSPIHKKKNEPMTFKEKLKQSLLEVQKQAAAGEKPATDKLTPAQLAAMSGGQVTPQQALLQTMAAMHQKAQELTGVAVPKYYNPAAVNPLKYAEQVQKRKLLWAKKGPATNPAMPGPSMSQPGPQAIPATAGCSTKHGEDPYGQNTMFLNDSDGKTAEKFRKLMGIKEEEKTTVYTNADMVKKQDELFDNLDKEYAFARMATHTHRGVGLGFTSQVYFPK